MNCWRRRICPPGCGRSCRWPTQTAEPWWPTLGCLWCRSPARRRSGIPHPGSQPTKHVVLELGGNAAAVVLADWSSDADLEWAATRIATFGNYQAGQSVRLGAEGVLVDESVYERFVPLLVAKLEALKTGAPPTRTFRSACHQRRCRGAHPVVDRRCCGLRRHLTRRWHPGGHDDRSDAAVRCAGGGEGVVRGRSSGRS